jgi:hypothetical protein
MEARFGEDFGRVRVHADSAAAHSARALDARAYTVGQDIVFAAGQYAPETRGGQHLLAHELTHTLQQAGTGPLGSGIVLAVSQPGDALEREADTMATQTLGGDAARSVGEAIGHPAMAMQIQRLPTSPPASAPATAATKPGVCGPDVTAQVAAALSGVRSAFVGWNTKQRNAACDAADKSASGALTSWDILPLFHGSNSWIMSYRPSCATAGAVPPCGSSVQVGKDCYFSGTANYVLFGVMCRLCFDHLTATDPKEAARFSEPKMLSLIFDYKGPGSILGTGANWAMCQEWSKAGYRGWPSGGTPPSPGDKANCSPTCPTPFKPPPDFKARWCPRLDPSSSCGVR